MVRGCQKRVIFLKNTDSTVFSEAYFIVNEDKENENLGERDLVCEANRIINEKVGYPERKPIMKTVLKILLESVLPLVVGLVIGLLINL